MFIRFAGLKRLGDTWQVVKLLFLGSSIDYSPKNIAHPRGDHNSDILAFAHMGHCIQEVGFRTQRG